MERIEDILLKPKWGVMIFLGLFPVLAITTNFEMSYLMGFFLFIILLLSSLLVTLFLNHFPIFMKIFGSLLLNSILVTILERLLSSFLPSLGPAYGVYLPLMVVSLLFLQIPILVSKKPFVPTMGNVFKIGLLIFIIMIALGLLREVLGNNTLTIMDHLRSLTGYRAVYSVFPQNDLIPCRLLQDPGGALLLIGALCGVCQAWLLKKGDKIQ